MDTMTVTTWSRRIVASCLAVVMLPACGVSVADMPIEDRRQEVSRLRQELSEIPDFTLGEPSSQTRQRQSLRRQLGAAIPTQDIVYSGISCQEALLVQREQIAQMRAVDSSVSDTEIEGSDRYASAERVRLKCKENAPSPTPPNVEIRVSATDLANAYFDNEIAADRKYKGKQARITGIVEEVDAGEVIQLSDGTAVTLFAYVLIHPEIPCFTADIDILATLNRGQQITVEGKVFGYRLLEAERVSAKIIDVASCKIVER